MSGKEVNAEEAAILLKKKKKAYVIADTYKDLELVREKFKLGDDAVEMMDMNDFYPMLMQYGEPDELKGIAKRYHDAIVICPHGRSSKVFVDMVAEHGSTAYSLAGGIEGLRGQLTFK